MNAPQADAGRLSDTPSSPANRLLEALCRERPLLSESCVPVDRPVGHEFCAQGERITDVYFPVDGVLSLSMSLRNGHGVDASTVGCEGFVGLPVFLGVKTSPSRVVQQVAGRVWRAPAREFCSHIEGSRSASRILKRFAAFSLHLGEQNAVCHLHHSAMQRACRWLLTAADRRQGMPMRLTQATLAETLGVRRQTVGELALILQRAGLVTYDRAIFAVTDREGIESRSCECYGLMRSHYDDVVGTVLNRPAL